MDKPILLTFGIGEYGEKLRIHFNVHLFTIYLVGYLTTLSLSRLQSVSECGPTDGMRIGRGNRNTGRNLVQIYTGQQQRPFYMETYTRLYRTSRAARGHLQHFLT
jgi:hypothetical protein